MLDNVGRALEHVGETRYELARVNSQRFACYDLVGKVLWCLDYAEAKAEYIAAIREYDRLKEECV